MRATIARLISSLKRKLCAGSPPSPESAAVVDSVEDLPHFDDAHYQKVAQKMRESAVRGKRPGTGDILAAAPVKSGGRVLDIGVGAGEASSYFMGKGARVTATGIFTGNFGAEVTALRSNGLDLVECLANGLPFAADTFDACWMSHVLEHTMNPGLALREAWRVLKPEGWLLLTVPPYKPKVAGGHLMTGWNVGQLIYVLVLNGFDVKNGHFARIDYNVCAFARKTNQALPQLHSDIGDIEALTNYWPGPFKQGSDGDLVRLNWPPKR